MIIKGEYEDAIKQNDLAGILAERICLLCNKAGGFMVN